MNLYPKLKAFYDGRRPSKPWRTIRKGLFSTSSVGSAFVAVTAGNGDELVLRHTHSWLDNPVFARIYPDGSFHFKPVHSLAQQYLNAPEARLLNQLTDGEWNLRRNKRVKYNALFGYARTAYIEDPQPNKRVSAMNDVEREKYWSRMYAYWRELRRAANESLYGPGGVWSENGEVYFQRGNGGWKATPTIPASVRTWDPEKKKLYRETFKQIEKEFELRTRMGAYTSVATAAVAAKNWNVKLEVPDAASPEALKSFVTTLLKNPRYSGYSKTYNEDVLLTRGKQALQAQREVLRRRLGAVVYSSPAVSQPSSPS